MLIEKEYDIEDLSSELNKRINDAEEYEEYNVKIPITKAVEILDVLNELFSR